MTLEIGGEETEMTYGAAQIAEEITPRRNVVLQWAQHVRHVAEIIIGGGTVEVALIEGDIAAQWEIDPSGMSVKGRTINEEAVHPIVPLAAREGMRWQKIGGKYEALCTQRHYLW